MVVRVTKEVNLRAWLELIVEVLIGVSIRKLNHGILQVSNAFEHRIGNYYNEENVPYARGSAQSCTA